MFFKWAKLWPLFVYFRLFRQTLQQINVKKFLSSIWRWESNSQPSDYESTPLTTRPGLSPKLIKGLNYAIL